MLLKKLSSRSGRDAITCYTCHRGQPKPATVPVLGQNPWQKVGTGDAKDSVALPTVDKLLDNYTREIRGKAASMKVGSRLMKGSRIGADGVLVPEEVYQRAPKKLLTVTSYPDIVFRRGFNGTSGWAQDSKGGGEITKEDLAELEQEAEFYKKIKLAQMYSEMKTSGMETIGGREAYVIEAKSRSGNREKLYFDVQAGLLVRRYSEFKTALGPFPVQTNYKDYKEVEGVKLPHLIRWSIPGRVWGRKIVEVKQNIEIDDAMFNRPGAKN